MENDVFLFIFRRDLVVLYSGSLVCLKNSCCLISAKSTQVKWRFDI